MRKITKRSAAIATAVVVAVGGAGAAFAAWTLNSSHDTSTVAGSAHPLDVTDLAIVGTLVPGTPASVQFNAHNPNSFAVNVSSITFSDIHTSNPTGCPANNLVAPDVTQAFAFTGGESKSITLTNALKLKANADDLCQGATFAFTVNLIVASDSGV